MRRLVENAWLALTAGLALRLFFVFHFSSASDDTAVYEELATNWLKHGVYGVFTNGRLVPADLRTPGYPAFLAAIYALSGRSGETARTGVMLAQVAVDLFSCLFIACLAFLLASGNYPRGRTVACLAFLRGAARPLFPDYSAVSPAGSNLGGFDGDSLSCAACSVGCAQWGHVARISTAHAALCAASGRTRTARVHSVGEDLAVPISRRVSRFVEAGWRGDRSQGYPGLRVRLRAGEAARRRAARALQPNADAFAGGGCGVRRNRARAHRAASVSHLFGDSFVAGGDDVVYTADRTAALFGKSISSGAGVGRGSPRSFDDDWVFPAEFALCFPGTLGRSVCLGRAAGASCGGCIPRAVCGFANGVSHHPRDTRAALRHCLLPRDPRAGSAGLAAARNGSLSFFGRFGMNRHAIDLGKALLHTVFEGGGHVMHLRDWQITFHDAVAGNEDVMFGLPHQNIVAIHEVGGLRRQGIQVSFDSASELAHLAGPAVRAGNMASERLDVNIDFGLPAAQLAASGFEVRRLPMRLAQTEVFVHLEM